MIGQSKAFLLHRRVRVQRVYPEETHTFAPEELRSFK
nr:hypothetical protein mcr_00293 [Micrococcus sp.]